MATKRRRNSNTRLLEEVVDHDGRNGKGNRSTPAMDELKSALDDLTDKVNRLVALQSDARKNDL